jgi:hypothetical protein
VDYTSTYTWNSHYELFDWAEFSFSQMPEVREAMRRLVTPFVTEVKFDSLDPENHPLSTKEERQWDDILKRDIQWTLHAVQLLLNVAFYGNDFISVLSPVERWLTCPDCGAQAPLRDITDSAKFSYSKLRFSRVCFSMDCRRGGLRSPKPHRVVDNRAKRPDLFKIKHWRPRDIVIKHYEIPDENEIFLRIPSTVKTSVQRGDPLTLATIDMGMLEALESNKTFKFKRDRIFHAKTSTLSGIRTNGWGFPRVAGIHKQAWLLALLRKSMQSIALDMDHPLKIISPAEAAVSGSSSSPMSVAPVTDFQRNFNRIIQAHRRDHTQWFTTATPVNAQYLGGQANQLFPHEAIAAVKDDMIDAAGIPIELYKGSMSTQASAMMLRLFETQNADLSAILNSAVAFVVDRIAELAGLDPLYASHQPIKLADDMQTLSLLAQLASAGQISMSEPLKRLGISLTDDLYRQFNEQKLRQNMQTKADEIVQKQQESASLMSQLQNPPPPEAQGAPAGDPAAAPAPGMPQTPAGTLPSNGFTPPANLVDWDAAAQSLAGQLIQLPPAQKNQELKILREQQSLFHAVVLKVMESLRYQTRMQAGDAQLAGGQ